MKNNVFKRWLSLVIACLLVTSNIAVKEVLAVTQAKIENSESRDLVITEIYPDDINRSSLGVGSSEVMEFIEIYNSTDEDIIFNRNYKIIYDYITKKKELKVTSPNGGDAVIPANTAAVLWVRRTDNDVMKNLTIEQFREAHNLSEDTVVLYMSGQNGINNVDRGFELHDNDGNILSQYFFSKEDVADGKSIELRIPNQGSEMQAYNQKINPTPGVVDVAQLTPEVDTDKPDTTVPEILITELCAHPLGDYRKGSGNQYEFIEVYNNSDDILNLNGYTLLYLYPNNTTPKKWTVNKDTSIEPYSTAVIWFAKEAITAGYTKTSDFNTHFNTNLKENDLIFYDNSSSKDFNIPNATNRGFAISKSEDVNDIIVEAWYDSTNSSSPDAMLNEVRNSSIIYSYPEDGSKKMVRNETRPYANPGTLDLGQVPESEEIDNVAPKVEYSQGAYNIEADEIYKITINSNEELSEAKVIYGTNSKGDIDYNKSLELELVSKESDKYIYEGNIKIDDVEAFRYIIVTKDKSNNETRLPYNSRGYSLTVNEDNVKPEAFNYGLSVKDGEVIRDFSEVYAVGKSASDEISISINGQELETMDSLGGNPIFGFQGSGIDQIYKTSTSAKLQDGSFEYFARVLPKYVEGAWYTYDMSPKYFLEQSTVTIHSGNENVPYDLNVHDKYFGVTNFDDFEVLNIHLVLPSGKLVKPTTATTHTGNKDAKVATYFENVNYTLGDGDSPTNTNVNKPLMVDFDFNIPDDEYIAEYINLDTTTYEDGTYLVEMKENGVVVDTAEITIDNTNPVIGDVILDDNTKLEDGMFVRGSYSLNVDATDIESGLETLVCKLDGEVISLPYKLVTSKLSIGEHNILIEAIDKAGNVETKSITFTTEEEKADKPENVGPSDSKDESKATLSAVVRDPFGEDMDVVFKEADRYDVNRKNSINVFSNVANWQDGVMVPDGEATINEEDIELLAKEDGKYFTTESETGSPYQRFQVDVTADLSKVNTVELTWKGNTVAGKNITMYGWDYIDGCWSNLKTVTAPENGEDITISTKVDKGRFVKDNKIQVKVQVNNQDKLKSEDESFNIMWFTDTQYYAQSYPEIFASVADWTVEEYKKGAIDYVIHTGDIVNNADDIAQWEVADYNMKKLDDANVPYGVLAGNHDSIVNGMDYSYYQKYFGENRFANKPWFGESMDNNRNHYDLVSFGGHDFVILYLGFGTETEEETINWANDVLGKYSDRNAIIGMHAYLETNATRSEMSQTVFEKIVTPNENVLMVLSGHYHGAAVNVETVTNADGSTRDVLEVLTDYQSGPEGGEGYVRMLTFNPEKGTVNFSTYSPYTNKSEYFGNELDNFTKTVKLKGVEKKVSTDYLSVNMYTDNVIGEDKGVKSGEEAKCVWENLDPNSEYFWYMDIINGKGVETRSEIYNFTTTDFSTGEDDGSGDDGNDQGGNGSGDDGNDQGGNGSGDDGNDQGGNGSGDDGNNQGGNGSGDDGNDQGGNGSGDDGNDQGGSGSGNDENDNSENGNTSDGNNGGNDNTGNNGSNGGVNNGNNTDSDLPKTGENTVVLPILALLCFGAGALLIKRKKVI